MNTKKIILTLFIGLLLGLALGIYSQRSPWQRRGDSRNRTQHLLRMFSRKLDLNDQQKQQVAAILEEKRVKFDALRDEVKPRFDELRKATRDDISKVLMPEQQKKFDVLDAKMMARRRK